MEPFGVHQIEWRLFYDQGFNAPLSKGLFFSTICITSVMPSVINLCAGCIALLVMPLPGKDSMYMVCMKDEPTALDRTILATYLSAWLIIANNRRNCYCCISVAAGYQFGEPSLFCGTGFRARSKITW